MFVSTLSSTYSTPPLYLTVSFFYCLTVSLSYCLTAYCSPASRSPSPQCPVILFSVPQCLSWSSTVLLLTVLLSSYICCSVSHPTCSRTSCLTASLHTSPFPHCPTVSFPTSSLQFSPSILLAHCSILHHCLIVVHFHCPTAHRLTIYFKGTVSPV
jgi:hypothetical protein